MFHQKSWSRSSIYIFLRHLVNSHTVEPPGAGAGELRPNRWAVRAGQAMVSVSWGFL